MQVNPTARRIPVLATIFMSAVLLFAFLFPSGAGATVQPQGEKAAAYAQKLVGKPFKYGGTTTKGFDASGFTQYVYSKALQSKLQRTSAEQYKMGKSVKVKDLKPGDLVFYKTNKQPVSFVGIYIGKQQFVAATSKGVTVQSMNASYWKTKYVGAKRLAE